ncbi:MAG: hypothetical protein HYV26_14120, partial [Candidatus Hydrogenedentes bacterium]|nr:hypothetical protein [Candidatus Hydrogenedentota bacterium]
MRILRYDELSIPSPCPTFRNKSWLALLALGVLMAAIAVYVATPKVRPGSPVLALFPALLAGFLLLLCLERLRICSKPTAWLLRVVEDGLYVNLRTFHNYQLGRDTHRVLFIPTDAIAAVCETHETRLVPGRRGAHKDQYSYVDILLKHGDLGPLQAALREERRLKPPRGWFARRK